MTSKVMSLEVLADVSTTLSPPSSTETCSPKPVTLKFPEPKKPQLPPISELCISGINMDNRCARNASIYASPETTLGSADSTMGMKHISYSPSVINSASPYLQRNSSEQGPSAYYEHSFDRSASLPSFRIFRDAEAMYRRQNSVTGRDCYPPPNYVSLRRNSADPRMMSVNYGNKSFEKRRSSFSYSGSLTRPITSTSDQIERLGYDHHNRNQFQPSILPLRKPQNLNSAPAVDAKVVKKLRRRTSDHQRRILEDIFEINVAPSRAERIRLSSEIDMTPREIQVWFQNKRQKVKYMEMENEGNNKSPIENSEMNS